MKYIMLIVGAIMLSACGNTVVGIGQDVQKMGEQINTPKVKVTK